MKDETKLAQYFEQRSEIQESAQRKDQRIIKKTMHKIIVRAAICFKVPFRYFLFMAKIKNPSKTVMAHRSGAIEEMIH